MTTFRIKTPLIDEECHLELSPYVHNDSPALRFVSAETNKVVIVASYALPNVRPKKNHIIINDYGDNLGIKKCLYDLGMIKRTAVYHPTGTFVVTEHAMDGPLLFAWEKLLLMLGKKD